jgi:hypothetical protein
MLSVTSFMLIARLLISLPFSAVPVGNRWTHYATSPFAQPVYLLFSPDRPLKRTYILWTLHPSSTTYPVSTLPWSVSALTYMLGAYLTTLILVVIASVA